MVAPALGLALSVYSGSNLAAYTGLGPLSRGRVFFIARGAATWRKTSVKEASFTAPFEVEL